MTERGFDEVVALELRGEKILLDGNCRRRNVAVGILLVAANLLQTVGSRIVVVVDSTMIRS